MPCAANPASTTAWGKPATVTLALRVATITCHVSVVSGELIGQRRMNETKYRICNGDGRPGKLQHHPKDQLTEQVALLCFKLAQLGYQHDCGESILRHSNARRSDVARSLSYFDFDLLVRAVQCLQMSQTLLRQQRCPGRGFKVSWSSMSTCFFLRQNAHLPSDDRQ